MNQKLWKLCFSPDGGGGAGGAAGGPAGAPEGGAQTGVNEQAPVAGEAKQRGRKGSLSNVVYGKDPAMMEGGKVEHDADAQETGKTQGKSYTDQDVQKIVGQRVGKLNQQLQTHQQTLQAQQPIIDLLMKRFNVTDASQLHDALMNNEHLWEDEAARKGKDWEDVRDSYARSTREEQLQSRIRELENQQHANETLQKWSQEAEVLKQTFPDFDLETEIENEEFAQLLQSGIPMGAAYKATHIDDIMRNAITYTYKTAQQQTADTIRARGMRPVENGMTGGAGVISKPDVNTWTRADREAAERQARSGRKVYL